MTHKEASQLIKNANLPQGGIWAELGAGAGTFTRVLAELIGEAGIIIAVDKDRGSLKWLDTDDRFVDQIIPHVADFVDFSDYPALDGILMANSLHYVQRPVPFLHKLLKHLKPGGSLILIEYDTDEGNPWVPYPISSRSFGYMTSELGLTVPIRLGRTRSTFGNAFIYAEMVKKPLKA